MKVVGKATLLASEATGERGYGRAWLRASVATGEPGYGRATLRRQFATAVGGRFDRIDEGGANTSIF